MKLPMLNFAHAMRARYWLKIHACITRFYFTYSILCKSKIKGLLLSYFYSWAIDPKQPISSYLRMIFKNWMITFHWILSLNAVLYKRRGAFNLNQILAHWPGAGLLIFYYWLTLWLTIFHVSIELFKGCVCLVTAMKLHAHASLTNPRERNKTNKTSMEVRL